MTKEIQYPVITIDGPSGTGKGTITHLLAQELGWHFLDSGALYRVLALAAEQHAVSLTNEEALTKLAGHLDVQFLTTSNAEPVRIILEGVDVTDDLRTESCGNAASTVAVYPFVREALLERQRAFLEKPGLVTDGRDMGTVVFPQADLKFYLDASNEARAQRRMNQLKEKGMNVSYPQILEEIERRDKRDRERTHAPLRPAKDAIHIDTTQLTIDQVLHEILTTVRRKIFKNSPETQ